MTVQQRAEDYQVEWVEMTPEQWVVAKREALDELGMTWDELREEARTHRFRSYEAQQVWMVLGGQES